jgi:uncharacterized protein (TIGR00255 family)
LISMSGFGQAMGTCGAYAVEILVRSVNGRYVDVRVAAPDEHAALVSGLEARIKARIKRGKVDVRLRVRRAAAAAVPVVSDDTLAAVHGVMTRWNEALGRPADELRLEHLLAFKEELMAPTGSHATLPEAELNALLDEALDRHAEMARREGARTETMVREYVEGIAREVARFEAALEQGGDARRLAIRERVEAALAVAEAPLEHGKATESRFDPTRLEQEIALIVERADVSEELTRLQSHLKELRALLDGPVDAHKGKKLDYLCVEVHRELNTSASKNALPTGTAPLIEARLLNERIREQAANVV